MAGERLAGGRRITLGPDKGYDTRDVVASCRALGILHTLRKIMRPGDSALDAHTVRYPGYALSQWMRKQVEEAFGWMKTVGGLRQTRYRGARECRCMLILVAAA
jgi:Transposase DDE domain